MGYTFEGILIDLHTGSELKEKYSTAIIIELHKDIVMIPLTDELYDAINHSLASLGVMKSEHQDEFDTVGLGRHRSVEGWVRGII